MTVPLLPPRNISRDHAVVKKNLSSKDHFVLGSRFTRTCPHSAITVCSPQT